jgi:hypothetical protein
MLQRSRFPTDIFTGSPGNLQNLRAAIANMH